MQGVTMKPSSTISDGVCRISLAALLGLVGLFSGCTLKSPQVPRVAIGISIPVANDTTFIQEVVEDRADFLQFDADSSMTLNFTTTFDDREVIGDRLQITPQAASFDTPIGEIRLPGRDVPPVRLDFSTLIGQDVPAGNAPLLPATAIDNQVEIPLDEIESLVIKEGSLDISVRNDLPVNLTGLRLRLVDLGNGGVLVDDLVLGDVPANGGTGAGIFDLAGKDISGNLAISVTGSTAEATDVDVLADAGLEIALSLGDLIVTEATAVIPQQEFSSGFDLNFPDDRIQVQLAEISRGGLTLRVRNDIPLLMDLELSLDDLKDSAGNVNVFRVDNLTPGEERVVDFDLNNNSFAPDDPLKLRISYLARTFPSDTPVTLSAGGEIRVSAETEPLFFRRVAGILNQLDLPIETVTDEVDFPDGLDNVELGSTSMEVFLTSAVGFRSEVELDIIGTNSNGDEANLFIQEVFERGNPDQPVSLIIRPDSRELTDFLNILPNQFSVTPLVQIGDGIGTESIEDDHWVQLDSVVFHSGARFRLKADTQIRPDPEHRTFDDAEARRRIESSLMKARVFTEIKNNIPVGVRVRLQVASRLEDVYTNPDLYIPSLEEDPFRVEAGIIGDNGRVVQAATNKDTIDLSKEDVLFFLQEGGVHTGVLVEFDATDGEVEVFGSDFVIVQAATEVLIEINEDLVE